MQVPPDMKTFFHHHKPVKEEENDEEKKNKEEKKVPQQDSKEMSAEPASWVRNVLSSASLNCALDLRHISQNCCNVEHLPQFHHIRIRIRSPKATAIVYANGQIRCSTNSVYEAFVAVRRFGRIFQKLGYRASLSNFKVLNINLFFSTFPLSLERLSAALKGNCRFEPELRPNTLFFRHEETTACVYHNGTICMTGSAKVKRLQDSFLRLFPALLQARRV